MIFRLGGMCLRVLYPDEIFIVNVLADYVLLILTARVTGGGVKRVRVVLASVLGGAYSVLAALNGGFFASPVPAIAAAVLMALTVFGGKKSFARRLFCFLGLSAAFGGILTAVGGGLGGGNMKLFAAAFLVSWAAFAFFLRGGAKSVALRRVEDIEIGLAGRKAKLRALIDTGNDLRDPISGRRVIVTTADAVLNLFEPGAAALLKSGKDPVSLLPELSEKTGLRFSLVPYRSLGVESGLILCFRPDFVSGRSDLPLVGVAAGLNIEGGGYSAIGYC